MNNDLTSPADRARGLLREADVIRTRARGDRRSTSTALLAFGTLLAVYAALEVAHGGRLSDMFVFGTYREAVDPSAGELVVTSNPVDLFWLAVLAPPLVLLGMGWWLRRRQRLSGAGSGPASVRLLAAAALVLGVVVWPVFELLHPGAPALATLLAFALWERDRQLVIWAIGGAFVLVVNSFLGFTPVDVAVAAALLVGGVVALRREARQA